MSQFDESKIARTSDGKFAEKPPAPEADGVDLGTAGEHVPSHEVGVSELYEGMVVDREEDGNFIEVVSIDNDHKSTSVEFADGEFESFSNDVKVRVGGYADPSDHLDEDTFHETYAPQQSADELLSADQVADVPVNRVWSVTESDEDDTLYADAGRREGAAGYLTSEKPWVKGNESGVLYTNESDVWMTDDEKADLLGDEPSEGEAMVAAVDKLYADHRDRYAAYDEHGPGSWGSYSSEVTLAHDAEVYAPDGDEETVLPAGTQARLRTDFENIDEGDDESEPLRMRVALEVPGRGDFEPVDSTYATMVDVTDSEDERADALEKIHTSMRYAAQHKDPAAFRSVAEKMSWQGSNPNIKIDFSIPERD